MSDQLHYVYSPMDLLGALRFLNGGSGDAQGLTKWAGASELKPLPETLKFLSLSNSFQEPRRGTLGTLGTLSLTGLCFEA